MTKVLFVCLGNICRSPTAHGIFEKMIAEAGLQNHIGVDSCGTGAWHIGNPPDDRTIAAAAGRGYDLSALRARKLCAADFDDFDYILAMDTRNLADIIKNAPDNYPGRIQLLLDYLEDDNILEVPDPYYGNGEGFERVFGLIESACESLLKELTPVNA
ncbi:Low molecular weight protein-tyrosine-phosphatase YfkJ [BD1-7 clade bacterium]|uniref:protein-tyrosine-phosphatase n=1 Tax=BD1-7 clade bacterium TaxID=2029982 RepID=A0A5S9P2E3_9GAMM|nr:Low molecular weight protein-tyrosine-phosphatase YfkJ [BD1-7 clade bacterium]CAA0122764.1 Low molecular weight protein-tyrosine-phosphatase YfkJ [BD1-7 clade bacterium]